MTSRPPLWHRVYVTMMVSVASIVVVCVESICVVTFLHKESHHTPPHSVSN